MSKRSTKRRSPCGHGVGEAVDLLRALVASLEAAE